jgi:hypothetical protein
VARFQRRSCLWPPTAFFPLNSSKDTMERYKLIASEYGFYPPDDIPVYRFQQLSEAAQERRDKRIEAAEKGHTFVG